MMLKLMKGRKIIQHIRGALLSLKNGSDPISFALIAVPIHLTQLVGVTCQLYPQRICEWQICTTTVLYDHPIHFEATSLTILYQLCDNCFVGLLWNRVSSVFLADSDHSDYLIDQLQDIEDVCSTQLPEITIRNLPPYQVASVTATRTTSAPATTSTCAGQTVSSGSGCDSLSTTYGVSTGDLQAMTGDTNCLIKTAVCLPAACTLQKVASGQTCDTLATGLNITAIQFLSWNKNVMGLCDSLSAGQYICGRSVNLLHPSVLPGRQYILLRFPSLITEFQFLDQGY